MRGWRGVALGERARVFFGLISADGFGAACRAIRPRRIPIPPRRIQTQTPRPSNNNRYPPLPALPKPAQEPPQIMSRTIQEGDAGWVERGGSIILRKLLGWLGDGVRGGLGRGRRRLLLLGLGRWRRVERSGAGKMR